MTKYRAKIALHELISKEMIQYESQGRPAIVSFGEYSELIDDARPPVNGYSLTKQAFRSEIWKKAYRE